MNPAISDGSPGVTTSPFNPTTNTIYAYINSVSTGASVQATVAYAGLAPGEAALYQLNVTIPTGVTAGDNYLEIAGPDSDAFQSLISIAGTSSSSSIVKSQ